MNKISVIVPVYNVEKYLSTCLDSIVHQTYGDLEIILVDDGSTDRCPEICDRYAREDKRVRVIHKDNGGLSDARNAGMAEMRGAFVSFVDSDDCIAPDMLQRLLELALNNQADIAECAFLPFEGDIPESPDLSSPPPRSFSTEEALESLMRGDLRQVVWNKLYTVDVVNGITFENGKINEDEFWTCQVFGNARKIVRTGRRLYFYRQRQASIMSKPYTSQRLDGLEAIRRRTVYIERHFPRLVQTAKRTYCFSSLFHYQQLIRTNMDKSARKAIMENARKIADKPFLTALPAKERLWLFFFFRAPVLTGRIRNLLGLGR
ncbi:MAG: glycosyltransferase [Lentisphaeria bacterium]|nr:glycosyltransferase [Lentisphaeria bacterium]